MERAGFVGEIKLQHAMRGSNVTNYSDLMHRLYINNVVILGALCKEGGIGGTQFVETFFVGRSLVICW